MNDQKEPTELEERMRKFVNHLRSLNKDGKEDRGALADLRSGLGMQPGESPRMHKHIVPYLGERESYADRWFYVVGAMFGAHPVHSSDSSMGKCFGLLKMNGSDSIEKRFTALIASHPNDLTKRLSHAAGLLASKKIGIDYYRLLKDLANWDNYNHAVQNQWARDFYYKKDENTDGKDKDNE